jgi:hypothetical protein
MLWIPRLRHSNGGPVDLGTVIFDVAAVACVEIMGAWRHSKLLVIKNIDDFNASGCAVHLDGVDRNKIPAPLWRPRIGYLVTEH